MRQILRECEDLLIDCHIFCFVIFNCLVNFTITQSKSFQCSVSVASVINHLVSGLEELGRSSINHSDDANPAGLANSNVMVDVQMLFWTNRLHEKCNLFIR